MCGPNYIGTTGFSGDPGLVGVLGKVYIRKNKIKKY